MADNVELDRLYKEAQTSLKAKEYDRARELFKQIISVDHDYKDASRLLAQAVKLKRRKWFKHPVLWWSAGILVLVFLGISLAPHLQDYFAKQVLQSSQEFSTEIPTSTVSPTITLAPSFTPTFTPMPFSLTWKRISQGQDVKRDTITAIAVDPRDEDVIYVGTEHAGIYKTIDGARSWFPSHDGLERAQVKEIVIDPSNSNILNVHTYPDQIYRTTDGGKTWRLGLDGLENYRSQDYYLSLVTRKLIVDPHNTARLILTDRTGWHESNDSGATWLYQEKPWKGCPSLLGAVGFHPTDPSILVLSQMGDEGECKNGIYRWDTSKSVSPELVYRFDRNPGEDLYHFRVIRDFQSARTSQGLGYLYARANQGWLFFSVDGGITWRGRHDYGLNSDPACPVFTVRPDGQGLGFCNNGRIVTTYGGSESKVFSPPSNDTITSISFLPSQSQSILVGGHGLSLTLDNGVNWTKINDGLPGISVDIHYSLPVQSFFMLERARCNENESLYKSMDNGKTWKPLTDQGCGLAIDIDETILYRWIYGTVFLSRNGGNHWAHGTRPTIGDSQIISVAAHPNQTGTAIVKIRVHRSSSPEGVLDIFATSEFYITTDRGFTWQQHGEITEFSSSEDALFYAPGNNEIIYSVGSQSNVFRLDNGDGLWKACALIDTASPNSASMMAIHPNNPDKMYLATLGKGIQYSADGCKSWNSVNQGLESLFVNTIAIDPNNPETIYAGTDSGAYISFNSGQTWNQLNDGLLGATVVYSMAVDKDGNVYAATPYGIFKLENK